MRQRARGFTLLELIVVIAVFAVFAAMAYGGLNYVLTARRTLEVQLARTAEWQKAFQRVRNDLELAVPRATRDGFGQPLGAFTFEEFGARIEFTRSGWRNPLSQPRPSLERVVYRYDDRSHELLRETWRVLDRAADNEPAKLVVLGQIDDARWRFMDSSRQWQEHWPPASTSSANAAASALVPKAIELTLESKDFGEVVWLLRPGVEAAVSNPTGPNTPRKCNPGEVPTIAEVGGQPSCVP
jgi:general secretion pathway protein J